MLTGWHRRNRNWLQTEFVLGVVDERQQGAAAVLTAAFCVYSQIPKMRERYTGGSMKQIENYSAEKYSSGVYSKVEDGIFKTEDDGEALYVTSLSFVQEPEFEEGENAGEISQYPLEDILDEFLCHIGDFYEELNTADSLRCCLEFASPDVENVRKLRTIIGKHVYNKEEGEYVKLIIE